ncbi:ABC transporter thiamine pyrophosphate-binding lipoprotein p37/Cypl [Mycoplasmopsis verecunda]|uniref:Phosphonate transport system substrate-binding protein n=1 Tax=Mycoplasmopsis verecunda TaxID=171291 RepID=A0A1T4LXP3_9BACT|nr:hypothetical protein [Mycoplasmopsis verecunda]WPB54735.1 hypothetical protein SAM46_01085 [Mycoplasmopsis verecunda]SJZ59509.1 phosphonate transport system substrate-binding protein [Mycoplasmopsis verecunda]
MKKIKNGIIMGTALFALASPLLSVACKGPEQNTSGTNETIPPNQQQNKVIKIQMLTPWSVGNDETKITKLKTDIQTSMNNYLQSKNANISVDIKMVSSDDYQIISENIAKGESDLGFVSSGSLVSVNTPDNEFNANIIQTLTSRFLGDVKDANYGTDGMQLQQIAQAEQEAFNKIPWSAQWNDAENGNGWNGSSYTKFYADYNSTDSKNLVGYQRGLVAIVANDEVTQKIIQAWNNKNLAEFVSYGLGIGKPSSGSKYFLPEALMKKQFNTAQNVQLKSFADLSEKYSGKLVQAKFTEASDEKNKNIHIFFDNEASYSYTKYKDSKAYAYAINPTIRPEEKITFLTVTDPLPFNIGILSKNVNSEQISLIIQALDNLNTESIYGRNVGFFGYENSTFADFKTKLKQTLGE